MKTHLVSTHLTRRLLSLGLLAVLLAACAPSAAGTDAPSAQPIAVEPSPTLAPVLPTAEQASPPTAESTQELAPTPLPVATSRGPDLHATDPTTVSLASGGLQFVEFFRFT